MKEFYTVFLSESECHKMPCETTDRIWLHMKPVTKAFRYPIQIPILKMTATAEEPGVTATTSYFHCKHLLGDAVENPASKGNRMGVHLPHHTLRDQPLKDL